MAYMNLSPIFHGQIKLAIFLSSFQAGQAAGLSEEQIKSALGKLKDQAVKDRLKQYTEEALKYGVRAFCTALSLKETCLLSF